MTTRVRQTLKRTYATFIGYIGGIVVRSVFRDAEAKGLSRRIGTVAISAPADELIDNMDAAFALLKSEKDHYSKRIIRWISRFAFCDERWKWKNFCDGTLLFHPNRALTPSRMSAYLYRIALENMLFNRFRVREVLLNDARCKLLVYRRELELMERLGCAQDDISEQRIFIDNMAKRCRSREI